MLPFRASALAASLVLLLALTALPAPAQEWRQEIQIITPVAFGDPTHVLLDSLAAAFAQSPDRPVQRAPDAATTSYADLREALYADGIDLQSASHAFLRYRFDLAEEGSGVVETLQSVTFIFRLDESRADVPILHLDTRSPIVSSLLTESGLASTVNMKSITPFRTLVAYPYLNTHQETALVEFGGKTVRAALPLQQAAVLDFIEEHMTLGTYGLRTTFEQMTAGIQ